MSTIIAILFSLLLCATPAISGDDSGIFRGRWWSYYERGVTSAEQGELDKAAADLQQAIRMRTHDQRMARTYGMHFIDFFAHRELGIVLYRKGELEQALPQLDESYRQEKSAKAAFYLNLVRGDLLRKKGGASTLPPEIRIDNTIPPTVRVREPRFSVSGSARSSDYIAGITINGEQYPVELAQPDISFSGTVELDDGENRLALRTHDLLGRTAQREIIVTLDRQGPLVAIETVKRRTNGTISITGEISDDSTIDSISINGAPLAGSKQQTFLLDTAIPATAAAIDITARDSLGNETTATVVPERDLATFNRLPERILLAFNAPGFLSSDKEKPFITLKDSDVLPPVFVDSYFLEGNVSDNNKVERILINGRELPVKKGKKIFFSTLVKLKEGNNKISVEAFDGSGNRAHAELNVRRQIPVAMRNSSRMNISILPFGGKADAALLTIADDLLDEAVVLQKRFRLIEREKLNHILQEQKLVKAQLTDPEHSLRIGKLISADALVATTARATGTSLELVSRVINTENSEVMGVVDVYGEESGREALRELTQGLAAKLARAFPLVGGMVISRDRNELLADIGASANIKQGMGAVIYRKGKEVRHPATGKLLGSDTIIVAEGVIEEVQDGFSKVRLTGKHRDAVINAKDLVVTK